MRKTVRHAETLCKAREQVLDELVRAGIRVRDKSLSVSVGPFEGEVHAITRGLPGVPLKANEAHHPHVTEIEVLNTADWLTVRRNGVEMASEETWKLLQMLMGVLNVQKGLYVALDVESGRLYTEYVKKHWGAYPNGVRRIGEIIAGGGPPQRISGNPKFHACVTCAFRAVCHQKKMREVGGCRVCTKVNFEGDTTWTCSLDANREKLSAEKSLSGCEKIALRAL